MKNIFIICNLLMPLWSLAQNQILSVPLPKADCEVATFANDSSKIHTGNFNLWKVHYAMCGLEITEPVLRNLKFNLKTNYTYWVGSNTFSKTGTWSIDAQFKTLYFDKGTPQQMLFRIKVIDNCMMLLTLNEDPNDETKAVWITMQRKDP